MPLGGIWRTLGRVGNIIGIIGAFVAQARGPGPAASQPPSDRMNRPT